MRRLFLAFPILALLASTTAGQEAVTIKIAYPQAGQRSKVTLNDKTTTKTSFAIKGKAKTQEDVKIESYVYVDEIIDNPNKTKLASKLKRTYEKASVTTNGKSNKLSVEGKTVLIEKKGDRYQFSMGGKPIADDARQELDEEFNKPDGTDVRDIIFPKKPVKPGDTWKIDTAELVKSLGETGPIFARDKVTSEGTLVKTYQKGGRQFGVIEFTFEAPITGLAGKEAFAVKDGKMTMKISGDGCIDGTASTGKSVARMTVAISGSAMGVDLKVNVDGDQTRVVEALPGK